MALQVFLVHAQPFVGFCDHLNIRTRTSGLGLFDRLIEGPHRGDDYPGSRLCREYLPPY
jgi:hypothetical protein